MSSTQFTNAVDMREKRFYYHTQFNRRVRMIDLDDIDFDAMDEQPVTVPMDDSVEEDIETVNFGF